MSSIAAATRITSLSADDLAAGLPKQLEIRDALEVHRQARIPQQTRFWRNRKAVLTDLETLTCQQGLLTWKKHPNYKFWSPPDGRMNRRRCAASPNFLKLGQINKPEEGT